ncbi:integrase [Priestia aryabhattai]|uniref:integrase n=1 Tax=Priestia aryabhattai TaxID=412384 RepID=UPI0023B1C49F|nr:integrase [Priestia aryabhattai]MDE8674455.1 integrase [Priestia aryabhattai]
MKKIQKFETKATYLELLSVEKNLFNNSTKEINEYKKIFRKWMELDIIQTKSFNDSKWLLVDQYANSRRLVFDLPYSSLNTTLKCFALSKIEEEFSITHIQQIISSVYESIIVTKGFKINYLSELEDYISKLNYAKSNNLASATVQFLLFTPIASAEEFINTCTQFYNNIQKSRELPNYRHILFFDEKLNHFVAEASNFEKEKYFPIIIWWKLTTIIPLRPIEFSMLKRNCITEKKGNIYEITLPREKNKHNLRKSIEITDTLRVNKEIFDLIQEFRNLDPDNNEDYLFTYRYYQEHKEFHGSDLLRDTKFLRRRQMDSLLDQFYKNILIRKYKYDGTDKLSLGDTRHFAFCNMMLQGFNMLSIARIGGHAHLDKQQHYWGHLKYFSESWVYNLAEKSRRLENLNITVPDANFVESNRRILNSYKLDKDKQFQDYMPVDYGYCLNTDYPNNCSSDCRFCSFYKFHPDNDKVNEGINWLNDLSQNLSRKINEQISLLTYISKNIKYDLKSLNYSLTDQEDLSYASSELNRLLHQQALLKSKIPKHVKENKL